jgi:DnaK suppressor protein
MINETDRNRLREHICREQEKVKADIESLGDQTGPVRPDDAIGRLSRMEAINSRSITDAKLRDAKSRLVLLDHALRRIDDPDFGLCTECGDPIALARLEFMPESRFCVDCADK